MSRELLNRLRKSARELGELAKTAGKDIHSDKWKRCVEHVKKKGETDNPYAVCTAAIGDESFKGLAKSDNLTQEDLIRIDMCMLEKNSERLMSLHKDIEQETVGAEDIVDLRVANIPSEFNVNSSGRYMVTPNVDELYGQSSLPRPKWIGDPLSFRKEGDF